MENRISKKIISAAMLVSFMISGFPVIAYGQDLTPVIRSEESINTIDINTGTELKNGDSIVNLSLRDADVKQVIRMFADQAGMNIIFAQEVEGSVTMDLVNISLQKALSLVLTTNKLKYSIQGNTMIVMNKKDEETDATAGSKDIIIVPVKYVSAASIAEFLNKSIFNKNSISAGVSTKPVVVTNPTNNELIIMGTQQDALMAKRVIGQFDKKPPITNYKVNHVTPAEMANLICSNLIPSFMSNGGSTGGAAGIPTGFASSSVSSSSGGLSIGGGKLVCSVNQSARAEDLESLPFKNMTVSYFPTIGTIQIIGGSPTQLEMIKDYIAANDIKSPQAYLEIQIISLSEQGSKTFDNTWQYMSKGLSINASGGVRTASSGGGKNYPIFFAGHGFSEQAKGSSGTSTSKDTEGDISYGQWSSSPQLIWTINYLVENNKGRVLANPRILITNGQQSIIDLTSDYVAKVTSQFLDSTGIGSSQVQKDYDIKNDNGIKVSITPFISPDGYVTLDIKPNYSTIAGQLYSESETGIRDLQATLLQRRNLDLKGIRIKDGETLIIGGMIQEYETKNVTKIPVLGDLPLIGAIFRSTGTQRQKEEMVIMITPQIIVDTEDASEITDLDL